MSRTAGIVTRPEEGGLWYGLEIDVPKKKFLYAFISERKREADELKQMLMNEDLSPVHFDDVVRDFLLGKAYERIERNGL